MGDGTLPAISEPATVEVDDTNKLRSALIGDLIPRNASTGAAEDNVHKLGRPNLRWKEAHITDLILGGALFDPDAVGTDQKFAISSGATRTDSEQPDFLRASGSGATATLLATATDFQYTANNNSVTLEADVAISSLTVAPSSNNTALVNDTGLAGELFTKYIGEDGQPDLIIDTVGTEISNRIGEYICLKTPTGEFMLAFVENATTLSRCYRGFFFDDNGDPVVRGALSNNDTLTIMSLGWTFIDKNGTTIDISYTSPIYSGVEPSSPVLDDYWFDLKNRLWKRHNGTSFVSVDRTLIGLLVIETVNCAASRSSDFTKSYGDFIDLKIEIESVTQIKTQKGYSRISVYGQIQELYAGASIWDITADLESGVSEAASTIFYAYLTEEGIPKISDERPYNRESELRGFYHPYHSWRSIGTLFNDSGSDIVFADSRDRDAGEWVYVAGVVAGDNIEFIGLPDNITDLEVIVMKLDSSVSNTQVQVQIGGLLSFDTSGYDINVQELRNAAAVNVSDDTNASGFEIGIAFNAPSTNLNGAWKLRRVSVNDQLFWQCDWHVSSDSVTDSFIGVGTHSLSGALGRIRLNRANTSGSWNNGEVTFRYK